MNAYDWEQRKATTSTADGKGETMNKYAGHTPGPWRLTIQREGLRSGFFVDHNIDSEDGYTIVASYGEVSDVDEANARLIADAPRLLAERNSLQVALDAARVTMEAHRKEQKKAMEERDALLAACKAMLEEIQGTDSYWNDDWPLARQLRAAIASVEGRRGDLDESRSRCS